MNGHFSTGETITTLPPTWRLTSLALQMHRVLPVSWRGVPFGLFRGTKSRTLLRSTGGMSDRNMLSCGSAFRKKCFRSSSLNVIHDGRDCSKAFRSISATLSPLRNGSRRKFTRCSRKMRIESTRKKPNRLPFPEHCRTKKKCFQR